MNFTPFGKNPRKFAKFFSLHKTYELRVEREELRNLFVYYLAIHYHSKSYIV